MPDKLLFVSDFAVHSGFARVGESLAYQLRDRHGWEPHVLALNYNGDPHPLQKDFTLYPPALGGDQYGFARMESIVKSIKPKAVFVLNDPWVCPFYLKPLAGIKNCPPVVCYCPVDGPNLRDKYVRVLNGANRVVAYTNFGRNELRAANLEVPCEVIPHGIDLNLFSPADRIEARDELDIAQDDFVVLWADRNSLRKRPDLAIECFAKWVHSRNLPGNVKLFMYCALDDVGYDLPHLARYWGVEERLIVTDQHRSWGEGVPHEYMRFIYSVADLKLSTTMGEGFGLTTFESIACGIPNIVPRWSALGEWPKGAVEYVECPNTLACPNRVNCLGGIPDVAQTVTALDRLRGDPARRAYLRDKGLRLVQDPRYRWESVGDEFNRVLRDAVADGRGPDVQIKAAAERFKQARAKEAETKEPVVEPV